ncbi:MAG: aldehyde dehydrogenase family protein, partial [Sciscionella sp.]
MSEKSAFTPTPRPCWIAGAPEQGVHTVTVTHPFDGSEVAEVAVPGGDQVEHAVAAAASATTLPADGRVEVLERVAAELATRAEEIAETITAESGKPLRLAETEVRHAGRICRLAAEETRRLDAPASLDPDGDGIELLTSTRRHPRGPVLAITPFSSPLCAVVNDVAAATAVGAPVLVKPASATPLSALLLGEILAETELPAGAFSILPLVGNEMAALLREPRLPVISFSGSASSAG